MKVSGRASSKDIFETYFDWMCDTTFDGRYDKHAYVKLYRKLYDTDFMFFIPMDKNRARDGENLRYIFGVDHKIDNHDIEETLDARPCSVLEMMVALAVRCEESIMRDSDIGDRTGYWFWNMIDSLGLTWASDNNFNETKVNYIITRFLHRKYTRRGAGGLFTINNSKEDLREVQIWYQMCWYLDEVLDGNYL